MKPEAIEALSFQLIEKEAGPHAFSDPQWAVVRRVIHTTADFEYLSTVRFHPDAIATGVRAIREGKSIVSDTRMSQAGMKKKDLSRFGVSVECFIEDPRVVQAAAEEGITRAAAAVDAALEVMEGGVYVVGNAPTALLRLVERLREKTARPALVVGFPVGFVNAAESKAALLQTDIPYITNTGRKGGSNVAAAVINALLIMA